MSGPTCRREPQGSAVPTAPRDLPKLGLAPPPVWSTGSVAVLPGTPGGLAGPQPLGGDPHPPGVPLQEGFGWTNGVVLMLLDRYGDRLSSGTQGAFLAPGCLPGALLLGLLLSFLPQ